MNLQFVNLSTNIASLRIQSEYGKKQTTIQPYLNNLHAVFRTVNSEQKKKFKFASSSLNNHFLLCSYFATFDNLKYMKGSGFCLLKLTEILWAIEINSLPIRTQIICTYSLPVINMPIKTGRRGCATASLSLPDFCQSCSFTNR